VGAVGTTLEGFSGMFLNNTTFNQSIGHWDVSSARIFQSMFNNAESFNQDISSWDVSNATEMYTMFGSAISFNQDISSWTISSNPRLYGLLNGADAYNQDLSDWCVENNPEPGNFSSTDQANYVAPNWGVPCLNEAPAIQNNQDIAINSGSTTTISSNELQTTDDDDTTTVITYIITSQPQYGTIQRFGSPTVRFTQANIDDGNVSFVHNGGSQVIDSFSFDVTDGQDTLPGIYNIKANAIDPVISAGQSFAYAAGQSSGATLGTVSATDDAAVTGFSINSVTGADEQSYTSQGWFAISSAGVVSLTSAGAGEVAANSGEITPNGFTLSITAIDGANNTDTELITLSVDGAAPVIVAGQSLSYAENQTVGQTVTTLQVSDEKGVASLSIDAVTAPDEQDYTAEGYFSVSNSGAISLTEAGVASSVVNDFETEPNTFTLAFTASDAVGNTDTETVTLLVTNLDEALPVMGPDVDQTYAEGQALGASLAQVTATDNEGITAYEQVSVVGTGDEDYSADAWFEISTTGHLSLTEAGLDTAVNNYDIAPNEFTLAVVARDAAGNQAEDTATVTLHLAERVQSAVTPTPMTEAYLSAKPTLSWGEDPLATQYHVEVYTMIGDTTAKTRYKSTASQDTSLVMADTVTTTSITLPQLDYESTYQWRVRPSNGYSDGLWSSMSSFTTEFVPVVRASLISPAQNANEVDMPTVFMWDSVANAVNYEFQLFTDAMLTEVVSLHTTDTTLTLDTLKANTDYLYRVRAKNATSMSAWENHEFTTAASGVATSNENGESLPTAYDLNQNYPNPFNPTTTIRYALPQSSYVTLTVYNIVGQRVATLVSGTKSAGYHDVRFDASSLGSGAYVYRIQAGSFSQTRTLFLVK
jgi:surface protein